MNQEIKNCKRQIARFKRMDTSLKNSLLNKSFSEHESSSKAQTLNTKMHSFNLMRLLSETPSQPLLSKNKFNQSQI